MFMSSFKTWFRGFRDDERGSIMLEAVITLPLLFWAVAASYEFFELHRYASARDKAAYTVADMISREMQPVTPVYLNNAKTVFDTMANDTGVNQLRVSVVKYDVDSDTFSVVWSQIRGTGSMAALTTSDVEDAHDKLPVMRDGEEVIVVEAESVYPPIFEVGIGENKMIESRVLTSPRFAPQILWSSS